MKAMPAIVTWADGTETIITVVRFQKIDSQWYQVQFEDGSYDYVGLATNMRWKY